VRFVVVGVTSFSTFAGVVGGGRPIVVMNAVLQEDGKDIGKPRGDTARVSKGKKPTVKPKTAAGMA
jgi:hypothetical protein